ncbi:MAG: hypothetical protein HW391_283 [Chloroflexi bacterium]|nr:hypothetical protein [Chloroflexota bacterium]
MDRRPDPDVVNQHAVREPIQPDHGYRADARIGHRDAVRTRLAGAIALGIVLTGLAFAALGQLVPASPDQRPANASGRPIATALPDVVLLRSPAPTRLLTVYAGGLRWLDPATGRMSGDPYSAPRSGLFVDGEGRALCVCLEVPWSQSGSMTRVTLRRYDAGVETARTTLYELQSVEQDVFGDPIQVDAEISRDGRQLWLAHAVRTAEGWQIGVDRVDLATLAVEASFALDPVPVPAADAADAADQVPGPSPTGWITQAESAVRVSIRASPDASRLSVVVSVFSEPHQQRIPAFQQARFVIPAELAPGDSATSEVSVHDATDDPCDPELSAWATDRDFITICTRREGIGVQPYVRVETFGAGARDVAVGPPVGAIDWDWLLDTQDGVLYRWSSLAHVFTRLDLATGATATLEIDRARVGTGDQRPWTAPLPGPNSPWVPLAGDDQSLRVTRAVGSADGSLIYALGFRSVADDIRDDRTASTGIWVIDPHAVELVARWAPAAHYNEIGLTPGQEYLSTVALAGLDGEGSPADWAASVWFHDPRSGQVVEVLGDVTDANGFRPAILAPNAPRGIAGF